MTSNQTIVHDDGVASATTDGVALRVENVTKRYGSFTALRSVSLSVSRGTIHGLLGENGAGKSTLVGIISGQRTPTTGTIYLNGEAVQGSDVKAMEDAGVFLVTQEPMIVDHFSAAENLMLGIWPSRGGFVRWKTLKSDAKRMLKDSGIDPSFTAGKLNAVARRKLNILRAMFSGGKVIILDEPTAALTVPDRRQLFDFMRQLKDEGVTFIFISHYNDEILEICDAVSVLRDGFLAGSSENVQTMTSDQLSELVLGRGLDLFQRERKNFSDETPVTKLCSVVSHHVNLDTLVIRQGEIIGFTGLPGAGAKELAKTIFGLNRAKSGTISLEGGREEALPQHPKDAFNKGIAYLSDDRRKDGVVGHLSIAENIALSSLDGRSILGFVLRDKEQQLCDGYSGSMGIKAPDAVAAVDTLSGGNQQKVCLGRVLATEPRLLILDEPTRGIDVGVKQDVLRIIDELSKTGVSIVIVSTDTDELVRAVDRVCVFRNGSIGEVVTGENITTENLRRLSQA
ncbi:MULTISPECIES: sugar ABC transporter ATP-binding protein [Brucella]|jgi:simple sugar transport system ATP-binding protein|uniref:sugar ABC transporter ATP-binding protein n=1 Tax=Brucella TaxID=234 RepID=UPI000CFB392E|nr:MULTISPECIES: sugar ABC transporter ATP-binding protein [Brucella]MQP42574.1 ATP-binding cassette domain-containing protein [Ochrobactrum sp. MYb237]PQZ40998.1 sugar ABC transporter ATP-binding protein [Brucella pseudogrignonensis]PRA37296.1 sugar ABC transporter ATP-binding protein [Brucella pseudogrignonensis]PRA62202.1 sugar ABC transporter ATP-binding protein [Brucella pseudogrignonensis]